MQTQKMDEEEEEESFLLPARWWYASTAFPLIAGTFGPMANTFSICALAENWRVDIPPDGIEEHGVDIKDPTWCVSAINLSKMGFDGLVPCDDSWSVTVKARRLELLCRNRHFCQTPLSDADNDVG
jgi:hypothetical protein